MFKKGQIVYYARIMPTVGIYEISELKIRTVEESYFVGIEKESKHAFLFGYTLLNKCVFTDRKDALKLVKEAEKKEHKEVSDEVYYEEY